MHRHMQAIAVVLVAVSTYANAQSADAQKQPVALSLVESVQPVYPEEARMERIEGVVSLHAVVGVDGSIKQLSVVSGPAALWQAALNAVHQWRYRPYVKDGKPVEVATTINVNFALTSPSAPGVQPVGAESRAPAQEVAAPIRPMAQGTAVSNPRPNPHSAQARGTGTTTHAGSKSRAAAPMPVFWLTLAGSLAEGKSSHALATEVSQLGIDIYFDDGDAEWVRILGGTDELINALHAARYVQIEYLADPARWKGEAARVAAIAQSTEEKRSDDPGIRWLRGVALNFEQNQTDAIPELRKAITLKPDLACAHRSLAENLIGLGQKEEALSEAREAIRLMPTVPGPHMLLGYMLAMNGDPQGGIAELREAVRIAPDYFNSHYALADGLLGQKDTNEAIHEFREAVRLNPVSANSHYGLGRALYAKPDYDGAVFEFKEAIRLRPREPNAHIWLASALLRAGQSEEAAAEARTALMYGPKDATAKQVLTMARTKLSETAGPVASPQVIQTAQPTSSSGLAGSTWACQLVETDQSGTGNWSLSATFLEDGTAKVMNTQYGVTFFDYPPKWQLNGSSITILTDQEHNGDDYVGMMNSQTSMTLRVVGRWEADSGSLTCNRLTPLPTAPPPSSQPSSSASNSNHPPYDDKCLRTSQGNLGSVTITNICTQPIDLKFCYRKQGDSGPWTCTVTPRLEPNHTLQSPFCHQCVYDGRAAAYLSSRNLMASLPSDEEVASWTGSGPPQSAGSSGSSDGQRQWRFVNPSQNWDTLTFEIRGRNGDSTSDDWNDETTLQTVTLKPGEPWTEDCGGYFSLDIKWVLASSSDPQTDVYYASLVCYANNFVWNNNHNLREYDFPRQ